MSHYTMYNTYNTLSTLLHVRNVNYSGCDTGCGSSGWLALPTSAGPSQWEDRCSLCPTCVTTCVQCPVSSIYMCILYSAGMKYIWKIRAAANPIFNQHGVEL